MKTPLQQHYEQWGKGCGHGMCSRARNVVLVRGTVPCDVLFLGEAPGTSEDDIGLPFVGPAGKLMDKIIRRSGLTHCNLTHALANLVGCLPRDGVGKKAGEPEDDQIEQCQPRLEEFITWVAMPRLVVCVGKLADQWTEPGLKHSIHYDVHNPRGVSRVAINHPAFILRSNVAQQGLMVQRCVVTIATAAENLR